MLLRPGFILHMVLWFFITVVVVLVVGSIIIGVNFIFYGAVIGENGLMEMGKKGLSIGFRYSGVWAGGVGFAIAAIKGKKKLDEYKK